MCLKIVVNHALSQKIFSPKTRFAETKIFFPPLVPGAKEGGREGLCWLLSGGDVGQVSKVGLKHIKSTWVCGVSMQLGI